MKSKDEMDEMDDLFAEVEIRSQEELYQEYLRVIADYERTGHFLFDRMCESTPEEMKMNVKALCVAISVEENPQYRHNLANSLAKAANQHAEIKSAVEELTSEKEIPRIAGTASGVLEASNNLKSTPGFFG